MAAPGTERRVLVVDDDEGVRTVVSWQLEAAGYNVTQAEDGTRALGALGDDHPDLVVLDLSLPGLGGLDLLRQVRDGDTPAPTTLPIIVLSGRSGQTDRIVGLDQGADDYLVKPFSPGELEARVRSLLRRALPETDGAGRTAVGPAGALTIGELHIEPDARDVRVRGARVELTAKEFDLLHFFATNPRRVFSRAQLLAQVWQSSSGWQGEATVTEHVHRLRQKLELDPTRPAMLRTVRGVGYQFEPSA